MSSSTSSVGNVEHTKCFCGFKARLLTERTSMNYGRRFLRCLSYNVNFQRSGCSYFEWVDEPFSGKATDVIRGLVSDKGEAVTHIRSLKEALEIERVHNQELHEQVMKLQRTEDVEGPSTRMKKMFRHSRGLILSLVLLVFGWLILNMKQ